MLFLVLQQKNWAVTRLNHFLNQQLPSSVKADSVELTAILDIKDSEQEINNNLDSYLSKVWRTTQNDYPKSEKVEWQKNSRSTDVCDVIQLDDHRIFMIDSCGFQQLNQDPIIHVGQGVYPEWGDPVDSFDTLNHRWASDTVLETIRMNWYYLEICEMLKSPGLIYQRLRGYQ